MRPDDIRDWLRRELFQSFRLVVTDGTTYEIRHPEVVVLSRSTLRLVLRGGMAAAPGERIVVVALLHVIRLEMAEPTVSPSVN
jgi:hypothetical protein